MKLQPTEQQIVKSILEYLAYRKIFAWRNNTGAMIASYKNKERLVRYGAKGSPDIIGILPGGIFLGLEVKRPGGKSSAAQKEFGEKVFAVGGIYKVVHSVEEVQSLFGNGLFTL